MSSDFRALLDGNGVPMPPQKRRDTTAENTAPIDRAELTALLERLDATDRRIENVSKARRAPAGPQLPWSLAAVRMVMVAAFTVLVLAGLWAGLVLVGHFT